MSVHSVAEARDQFSNLIDRALNGEEVVITRQGRPMTVADVEHMREKRVKLLTPDDDPRSIVERMRDEDSERLLRR